MGKKRSSKVANPQFSTYREILFVASLCFSIASMSFCAILSQKDTIKFPPFGVVINGVLLIMSAIALCVTLIVTYFLICANYFRFPWMKSVHYTILKCIGSCSAILATCSLIMSYTSTHKLIWVGHFLAYSIGCCYHFIEYPKFNRKVIVTGDFGYSGYSGLVLVPLLYVMVLFLPKNLDWIVFAVGFLFHGIEMTCIAFNLIKENCKAPVQEKKRKAKSPHQADNNLVVSIEI